MQQRSNGMPEPATGHPRVSDREAMTRAPMSVLFGWAPLAVILLTSAIVCAMVVKIYDVDRTMMLAGQYFAWSFTAYLILTAVPRADLRISQVPSRMGQFLALFLIAFALSTAAVWMTGERSDMAAMLPQSAAVMFMALPFFVMRLAAVSLRIDRAVLLTCHVILGLGVYSVLGESIGFAHYESVGGRYFGSLGDGVSWALTLPLIVYFATGRIPLAAVAGLGLALTGSRGPALIAIGALVLLMFFSRGRRYEYAAMIVAMVVIGLYQGGLFTTLITRFSDTVFTSNDRTTTAGLGMRLFWQSPIFGNGYNALTHYFPSNAHRLQLGIMPTQTSTAVQMLSDSGAITFIPYLGFVISGTAAGIGLMRNSKSLAEGGLLNGLVAWLLAMLWLNQSALWFVVGSYIGPIVFGIAGIVAGASQRLAIARQAREPMRPVMPPGPYPSAAAQPVR